MGEGTRLFLRSEALALEIGSKSLEAGEKLSEILRQSLDVANAERGFIVVPTRKDPWAIRVAMNFGGDEVPFKQQVVSRELLKNARDVGDTVVTAFPFGTLHGAKGTFELKSETFQLMRDIRSAIAAPLLVGERMVGALVLHEQKRATPFTLDDRRALEPLARLAASVIADSAKRVRDSISAPIVSAPPPRTAERIPGLVGSSKNFLELMERIEKAARSEHNVLIHGETGTGKEAIANALHAKSRRASGPFVIANMAGLGGELVGAELFGYVAGAFTGALKTKQGLFARADGGTIFLDEIGELPLETQGVLLRVLQEKTIRPIGSTEERRVDVRIVAATNRDLTAMVAAGKFKFDLLMRLEGLKLETVPLRARRSDLREVVTHLVERLADDDGSKPKKLTPQAFQKLERHDWQGNVRELENVLRSALVFGRLPDIIDAPDLELRPKAIVKEPPARDEVREYLSVIRALHETETVTAAAKLLEISRATLYRRVEAGKDFDPDGSLLPAGFKREADD